MLTTIPTIWKLSHLLFHLLFFCFFCFFCFIFWYDPPGSSGFLRFLRFLRFLQFRSASAADDFYNVQRIRLQCFYSFRLNGDESNGMRMICKWYANFPINEYISLKWAFHVNSAVNHQTGHQITLGNVDRFGDRATLQLFWFNESINQQISLRIQSKSKFVRSCNVASEMFKSIETGKYLSTGISEIVQRRKHKSDEMINQHFEIWNSIEIIKNYWRD